jgi:hypothetical protein
MLHGIRAALVSAAIAFSGTTFAVVVTPPPAPAAGYGAYTFNFTRITSNNVENVGDQLFLQVIGDTNPLDGIDPAVYFKLWNRVGTAANITYVAADQAGPADPYGFAAHGQSTGVSFVLASPFPGNLPAGNTLSPVFIPDWGMQRANGQGGVANGINAFSEYLEFKTTPANGDGYLDVAQRIYDGDLRFGVHVQAIGAAGGSDTYITVAQGVPPVPEPGTYAMLALGLGLVGLKLAGRRSRNGAVASR